MTTGLLVLVFQLCKKLGLQEDPKLVAGILSAALVRCAKEIRDLELDLPPDQYYKLEKLLTDWESL